jgi:hypothetical protein
MLQATIQDAGPLLQVKGDKSKCTKNQSPLQGRLQGAETLNYSQVYSQISNDHKHTAFIPLDQLRRPPCAMRNFRVSFRETIMVVANSNYVTAVIIVVQKPNKHDQN